MTQEIPDPKRLNYYQFAALYDNVNVYFQHYYKYHFWFQSETDSMGIKLLIVAGGNADSIYRASVAPSQPYKIENLEDYFRGVRERSDIWYMEAYRFVDGIKETIHFFKEEEN